MSGPCSSFLFVLVVLVAVSAPMSAVAQCPICNTTKYGPYSPADPYGGSGWTDVPTVYPCSQFYPTQVTLYYDPNYAMHGIQVDYSDGGEEYIGALHGVVGSPDTATIDLNGAYLNYLALYAGPGSPYVDGMTLGASNASWYFGKPMNEVNMFYESSMAEGEFITYFTGSAGSQLDAIGYATWQCSSSPVQPLPITLVDPWGVVYDGDGHIYISSSTANQLYKITTGGAALANFTISPGPALSNPRGLAIDALGALYVADTLNNRVVKFAADGTQLATFVTTPGLNAPGGVAVGAALNLWIADSANQRIVQLSQNGTQISVLTSSNPPLSYPAGVTVDLSGTVYTADTFNNRVVKWTNNGTVMVLYNDLYHPTDLVVDSVSNVFIADSGNNRVVQVSAVGILLAILTTLSPALSYPTGLALDSRGDVYVADYYNYRVVQFTAVTVATPNLVAIGSLCLLMYSLPGTVDYPWSSATLLQFSHNHTMVTTGVGTAVSLISGSGHRTYTNRFGSSFSTQLTLNSAIPSSSGPLLYLNSASPFDRFGLTFNLASPVQLPGGDPLTRTSQLNVYSALGVIVEGESSLFDGLGQAFLSTVPGFINTTIGASNINSLSANYGACTAPITFTNGLRAPTQPTSFNGGTRIPYTYVISDGFTYNVSASLLLTTTSAFATTTDQLGNPYQSVVNITGTRTYTYLPTGQQLTSTVTGMSTAAYRDADRRLYPYALLSSAPGVYSMQNAPFLDSDGLAFSVTPAVPYNGMSYGANSSFTSTISVFISTATSSALITESPTATNPPLSSLQRQSYTTE